MARAIPARRRWLLTVLAWAVGLAIFFPILWTMLTSFKTEGEAISTPPHILFFDRADDAGQPANYGVDALHVFQRDTG